MNAPDLSTVVRETAERLERIPDSDAVTLDKSAVRVLLAALSTPPADDVREALDGVHYCPQHGDLLAPLDNRDVRSLRCVETHTVEQIVAAVRPYGTVTESPSDEDADDAWEQWAHFNWNDEVDMEFVESAFRAGVEAAREGSS